MRAARNLAGWSPAAAAAAALLACRPPVPATRSPAVAEPRVVLTARADRDTLVLGDTVRVWAELRNAGPTPVGVRYSSNCRFSLRVRAAVPQGGTLAPGRVCLLDLIAGALPPGGTLADTLRWDGRWGEQPVAGRPAAPAVPPGPYDVIVAFSVDACDTGDEGPRPGCARAVESLAVRLTVVTP